MIARENVSLPKMASTLGGVVEEPLFEGANGVGVSTVVTGRRASHYGWKKGWIVDDNAPDPSVVALGRATVFPGTALRVSSLA